MKYLTRQVIFEANDIDAEPAVMAQAEKRFEEACYAYFRELEKLKGRISGPAFEFLRHGSCEEGLHDGNVLAFSFGDGMSYLPDGQQPFLVNRRKASANISILNFEQNRHYSFDLLGVKRINADMFIDEGVRGVEFGDLYTYELVDVGENRLQLGLLFASGATVVVEFTKLRFSKRRIKPQYSRGDQYRLRLPSKRRPVDK
jgi:hypothetical protein